jgi:hypothetical protein
MYKHEGYTLSQVKAYARHTSIETTLIYTGEDAEEVVGMLQKAHDKE